ncbi:MOSC domain-containing protein [Pseudooceanicola sp. 502str34]
MARLAAIWRHPVKGVGAEPLTRTGLEAARPLPGDRAWAILTGEAQATGDWMPCRNFSRGCYAPRLMAVTADSHDDGRITFRHPDQAPITLDPARDGGLLVEWIAPLYSDDRPAPRELVAAPAQGMTDADFPSVALLGRASLEALSAACGTALDERRFRGNLWIEGLEPFAEFDWVGRRLTLGGAELEVVERIGRCRATEANPETGTRDVNTLKALREHFGHTDFGVYARVIRGGEIALGDEVVLQ